MTIALEPFNVDRIGRVETAMELDGIVLSSVKPDELTGNSFSFRRNPEPGYIDGSVYIEHAHHPVDVTKLDFVRDEESCSLVRVRGIIDFAFEGLLDFAATPFELVIPLESA